MRAVLTPPGAAAALALTLSLSAPGAARASGIETGPQGIAVDGSGDVYMSDWARNTIDEITPHGPMIIAGIPGQYGSPTPGPATASKLNYPIGLAVSAAGDLYVVDFGNCVVEKVTPAGTLSIVAGQVGRCGTPAPGPATSSMLASPIGVAVDSSGNLYIADQGAEFGANNVIEKITPSGTLSIFAGELEVSGAPTPGPAVDSKLGYPQAVAVDSAGDVYIADSLNGVVEKVNPEGILSIYAGKFNTPDGVATDTGGNVYVTADNMIEKVNTAGQLSIIAGTGQMGEPTPGPATDSMLNQPLNAAVDSGGNVYIADSGNDLVDQVTPAGDLSIIWNAANPVAAPGSLSTLNGSPPGTGSGAVSGQGLSCQNICSGGYSAGDQVTLSASPAAGSEFAGVSRGGKAVQKPKLLSFDARPLRAPSLTRQAVTDRCVAPTRSYKHERNCGPRPRLAISYVLSMSARVTIRISRTASGRVVGGRCVRLSAKNRRHRHCARWVPIHAALVENGNRGANMFVFNGLIGGARLIAGRYLLTATPTADEQKGDGQRATFTLGS